jgi:hypothetical protein
MDKLLDAEHESEAVRQQARVTERGRRERFERFG